VIRAGAEAISPDTFLPFTVMPSLDRLTVSGVSKPRGTPAPSVKSKPAPSMVSTSAPLFTATLMVSGRREAELPLAARQTINIIKVLREFIQRLLPI
jgi:hypothetical protein